VIQGPGIDKGAGNSNSINNAANLVIYRCTFKDNGNWQFVGPDIDCHGLSGFYGDGIWILESEFYHNQGDGIQMNGGSPSQTDTTLIKHVYIGKCLFYQNLQTGLWIKNGQDIIISSNEMRNHTDGGGSVAAGTGGQLGFNRVWWLYNYIHDNGIGIGVASFNGNAFTRDYYVIGNVISGCPEAEYAWGGWDIVRVCNNTYYDYTTGFICASNPGDLRLENNIFWGRNGGGDDYNTPSTSINEKLKNNFFPATTIAGMEAGDPTNRLSNQAGTDPLFANVGTDNFHILPSSPARDAGAIYNDVYATFESLYGLNIRKDFYGAPRPQGTLPDIGAAEFIS
jgi:hypothetical protein